MNLYVLKELFEDLESSGSENDYNAVMDELDALETYAGTLVKDDDMEQSELDFN